MQRWGRGRARVQRWRCRDCLRGCSSTTGTLLAGSHAPEKLHRAVADMLSATPSSCRELAAELAISAMTAWSWRQKVNRALVALGRACCENRAAADGDDRESTLVILRESRKASREWVDHAREPQIHPAPDRRRWIDYRLARLPLPEPMAPHLLPVAVAEDRQGVIHVEVWPAGSVDAAANAVMPAARAAGIGSPDGGCRLLPATWPAQPDGVTPGAGPAAAGNGRPGAFRDFLQPFRGPATWHLAGYAAWFLARVATPDAVSRRCLWHRLCALIE